MKITRLKISSSNYENELPDKLTTFYNKYVRDIYVSELLTRHTLDIVKRYSIGGYHFLTLADDDIIPTDEYMEVIVSVLCRKLEVYSPLFDDFEDDIIKIKGFGFKSTDNDTDNRTINITDTKTGENGETLHNEKTASSDNEISYKSMGENSPINADLNSINTPNIKSHSTNIGSHSSTDNEDKTSTKTINETNNKNGTDNQSINREHYSPEQFKIFMDVIKDYNISTIFDKCVRYVIHEFNASL